MRKDDEIDAVLRSVTEKASRGEFEQAFAEGAPLLELHPKDPRVLGVVAGVLWRTGRFEEAAELFARTTTISPRSELASVGLFHSLWSLKRVEEARAEATRFLSNGSSREYELLLDEMGWKFDVRTKSITEK